jgi:hypothetical protein
LFWQHTKTQPIAVLDKRLLLTPSNEPDGLHHKGALICEQQLKLNGQNGRNATNTDMLY